MAGLRATRLGKGVADWVQTQEADVQCSFVLLQLWMLGRGGRRRESPALLVLAKSMQWGEEGMMRKGENTTESTKNWVMAGFYFNTLAP